jgi:hypothetical protein
MNFNDYKYIPTLRTRASELLAVEKLSDETKSKILPFICLCKANRILDADSAFAKWNEINNKPVIVSLSDNPHLLLSDFNKLASTSDDFANWENFITKSKKINEGVIPSLILHKDVGKRDFVKQLQRFESAFNKIVLKINPMNRREVAAAITAASVINSTNNILFILDSGQIGREHQRASLDATIFALNELRSVDPTIEVVTTSTSFPRVFQSYSNNAEGSYGEIPMLEWENFHALGGDEVAIYGDYAGIHGEFYEGSYAKFVARVDYPTPALWIFERRKQANVNEEREALYSQAARGIITNESWDDSLDVWGSEIIKQAAQGTLGKFGSPSKWISVRVNLHIERIVRFLESGVSVPNETVGEGWDETIDW